MEPAPITTPITDRLASMPWIRWFRTLTDRLNSAEALAGAPSWGSITGKPTEFPPESHTHPEYIETETDPTVPAHVKAIEAEQIARWTNAAGAGVTGSPIGELSLDGSNVFVPGFTVRLFADAAATDDPQEFAIPSQLIAQPTADTRTYLCAQRSGDSVSLVYVLQADVYAINMSNIVPLWRLEVHNGTELHQIHYNNAGDGLPMKQEFAQLRSEPYRLAVEGGLAGTLTAGRSLTLTAAEVFFGHHRVSVLAFDADADTVHDYYHVSSAWEDTEYAGTWAWDNLQYDDGTDLVAMGNNKWGAIFVYRSIGDAKEIFVVRGQSQENAIEAARLIGVPPVPDLIAWHCLLVGRILFQKGASTGTWEPYSTATFLRSQEPQIALDDLTDVTVTGAAEASVLQKNLAGEWVGDLLPWDDMRHITAAKTTGANVPSYAAFGTSMYGWRFAAGDLLSCDSEQIPHIWAGTPIRPHVHFSSDNGGTGNVVWEVKIASRPAASGAWSSEQTVTKTWTGTLAAYGTAVLGLWDSPGVTLADTGPSTILKMRIRMVSKTFTGNVFLDGFDSHIQVKRLGTINEFGPL